MSEICVSVDEAARLLGINRATVYRHLKKGLLKRSINDLNGRPGVLIPESRVKPHHEPPSYLYVDLRKTWIHELRSGGLTGKPLSERTVQGYEYGLKAFWDVNGQEPGLRYLTSIRLRETICQVDTRAYAKREKIWLGVICFSKFLVREGLLPQEQLDWMRKWKPRRSHPPKKTVLTAEQVEQLVLLSGSLGTGGRTNFDKTLNQLLIVMFAYAGLRLSELANLELPNVDLKEGIIYVIEGKGNKDRMVGMAPLVRDVLATWLDYHRPETNHLYVLAIQDGGRLSQRRIQRRIQVLGKELGLNVHPHALRRSFATLMENGGLSWSLIQKALGHSDIRTTQGYVLSEDMKVVEAMKASQTP